MNINLIRLNPNIWRISTSYALAILGTLFDGDKVGQIKKKGFMKPL
jgi:hypothetical protein